MPGPFGQVGVGGDAAEAGAERAKVDEAVVAVAGRCPGEEREVALTGRVDERGAVTAWSPLWSW